MAAAATIIFRREPDAGSDNILSVRTAHCEPFYCLNCRLTIPARNTGKFFSRT